MYHDYCFEICKRLLLLISFRMSFEVHMQSETCSCHPWLIDLIPTDCRFSISSHDLMEISIFGSFVLPVFSVWIVLMNGSYLCFHFREEVFGPVAPVLRFKTEQDAIRIANDTNAGLLNRPLSVICYS